MFREDMSLDEILKIEVPEERVDRLKELVQFNIPGIDEKAALLPI